MDICCALNSDSNSIDLNNVKIQLNEENNNINESYDGNSISSSN